MSIDVNRAALELAAKELKPLLPKLVFVGGSTVGLYVTDTATAATRPTEDIDCVVEVASLLQYHSIEAELRVAGFIPVAEGPRCRFRKREIIVDVMPTSPKILGFTNKWYKDGIQYAELFNLRGSISIKIFSVAHFAASKLEAYKGRGNNDFRASHDIEDIITVIDGRTTWVDDILISVPSVKAYLVKEFDRLLKNADFVESVEGHVSDRMLAAERAEIVLGRLRQMVTAS